MKRFLLLLAIASAGLAACGSSDPATTTTTAQAPAALSARDSAAVADAALHLAQHCVNELAGEQREDVDYGDVIDAPDALIRIYREDPNAVYWPGERGPRRTMRQVLSDTASAMDSCAPDIARQLDRALQAGA